ncbi:eukaryotic mitochondrial regulator protein-domain-containing protein [Pyronema domesticum]|nr:eukaryotic mitochondrial regulator protein-domain-containing protein [Pyronema domesticum]
MPPRIVLPSISSTSRVAVAIRTPVRVVPVRALSNTSTARARESDNQGQDDEQEGSDKPDLNKIARDGFKAWIRGPGNSFRKPLYDGTNYLSSYDLESGERKERDSFRDRPFPLNPFFRSHPVLSEELKNHIHELVTVRGRSVRSVSARLGVSLERVGAVVRLKEVEKKWIEEGKPVATYLTKALHTMLKVTPLSDKESKQSRQEFHEGLQDMVSHPFSHRQAFIPVSESRTFTRADAGHEFGLPPTEEAVPHPDLVKITKERALGLDDSVRLQLQIARDNAAVKELKKEEERKKKLNTPAKVVERGRFVWRLQKAETGKVGFRYGIPHMDRKKGQVKIPTSV